MTHLCAPQNQAVGVCRGFVPDIQIFGTHGRKDLVNATITSNAEEEEEGSPDRDSNPHWLALAGKAGWLDHYNTQCPKHQSAEDG